MRAMLRYPEPPIPIDAPIPKLPLVTPGRPRQRPPTPANDINATTMSPGRHQCHIDVVGAAYGMASQTVARTLPLPRSEPQTRPEGTVP
jgi:hypothetical protein